MASREDVEAEGWLIERTWTWRWRVWYCDLQEQVHIWASACFWLQLLKPLESPVIKAIKVAFIMLMR